MLEKTTRINYLLDFYQTLLTPKQRNYISLYYIDDYSLGEIAEEYEVSRQAVFDNIKRTESVLEEYESNLLLFDKFQKRADIIEQMQQKLLQMNDMQVVELLQSLKNLE